MPLSQAEAATKNFGGFKPGKTFTFTVREIVSIKAVGFAKPVKAPIPAGVPKLKKGQKVKFTIGKKGELTAKGISIPFKADGGSANVYSFIKTGASPATNTAQVFKTPAGKPTNVALSFIRAKYAGFSTTTNTVTYTLK
jgi:hypothetical protein